jgi:hypothetical protein
MNLRHGQSGKYRTKEYVAWCAIRSRCYNDKNPGYKNYGGRGVIICEKWKYDFDSFLLDMGLAPTKQHSIERINNDGNYEPANCKWATPAEQSRNKRNNILVTYNGEELPLKTWCSKLNMTCQTASRYLNRGMTFEDIANNYHGSLVKRWLNESEVIILKAFLKEGISYLEIARELMIDQGIVWRIAQNRTYKNIAA